VRAVVAGGLLALLAIVAAACETIPDYPNRPLAEGAANPPPANLIGPDPEAPLILIAFSGGGSRAAALGLGVLDELAAQTYLATDKPVALIDRVKVVSSVSGGSVIAAWFGLVGPARIDELKSDFLARDNMATLVDTLKAAGASSIRAPGQPLFAGLRVYNVSVDFDQFSPEQRQLQTAVKNIGTSWSLSPIQLQQAIEAGRILLRQHPCFQRLLLDLRVRPAPAEPEVVRKSCPFEDDRTS